MVVSNSLLDSDNNDDGESNRYHQLVREGKICPYCGDESQFIDSSAIYNGESYGMIYSCKPCKAYVGVHKDTNKSLGSLANKRLRKLRKKAHSLFDPLWKAKMQRDRCTQSEARNAGYDWLSKQLNIPHEFMHIGCLGERDCQKVIELCGKYYQRK